MRPIYLLDTNIISEFYKPFPNKNVYKKSMNMKIFLQSHKLPGMN